MNIIELFEKLNINKGLTLQFSPEELIRIEKQVNVEKRINPEIDANVAANLIEALKKYPEEFHYITNNRILYNFFAKTSHFRDQFPKENSSIDNERVSAFISAFLEEELMLFFDQKLSKNNFDEMNYLLQFKACFPEDILFKLNKKAIGKVEFALSILSLSSSDLSKILYIKQRTFYDFLSHFSSIEMDEKLKMILNRIVDIYNVNKKSEFGGTTMISMSFYKAFDDDFEDTLKKNRDVVYSNQNSSTSSGDSWYSGLSWRTFAVILFILLRFGFFASKCSSDNNRSSNYDYNTTTNTNYEKVVYEANNEVLDSYFTNMKFKIDSFHVFLTDFNKDEIKQLTYNDSLLTGQNPFENLYKNQIVNTSKYPMLFKNTTKYDVILLENVLAYDSIKMPQQAHYIKAGETLKVDDSNKFNRVYNFYIGSGLASFQTNSKHLFIRNHSIIEPRFSKLLPETKQILADNYRFEGNVTIAQKNGKINITCEQVMQIKTPKDIKKEVPPKVIQK